MPLVLAVAVPIGLLRPVVIIAIFVVARSMFTRVMFTRVMLTRLLRARRGGVPGVLGIDQALKLAAIEEDAPTFATLIDDDAIALVLTHGALTLGTGQLHQSRLTSVRRIE